MKVLMQHGLLGLIMLFFFSSLFSQTQLLPNDSLRELNIIPPVDLNMQLAKADEFLESATFLLQKDSLVLESSGSQELLQVEAKPRSVARHLLSGSNNINLIQLEFNRLSVYSSKLVKNIEQADAQIRAYSGRISEANELEETWRNTQTYYEKVGLEKGLERAESLVNSIKEVESELTESLNVHLEIQQKLMDEEAELKRLLTMLGESQNNFLSGLLKPNKAPIWAEPDSGNVDSLALTNAEVAEILSGGSMKAELDTFFDDNKGRIMGHLLLSILVGVLLFSFKDKVAEVNIDPDKKPAITVLFSHPVVTWVMVITTSAFLIYPSIPFGIKPFMLALLSLPLLLLGIKLVRSEFRWPLFIILLLYNINQFIEIYGNGEGIYRMVMLAESLGGVLAMLFILRAKKLLNGHILFLWRVVSETAPFAALLFALAFVLNVTGYVALSQIITSVITSCYLTALIVVLLSRIGYGLTHMLLFHSGLIRINVIANYRTLLLKRSMQVFSLYLIYVWLTVVLRKAMLAQPVQLLWRSFYTEEFTYGALSISVQNITEFFVVLMSSVILANVIRAILEEDLLVHFSLKRGVPKAIAMVTKYTLLVVGFFLAVSSMGVDIDKLGFLAGGLGVGIGFGLQNIVGNFISGLILIFERPIHEGDVIIAGQTEGEVKEIGLRSCVVRSWDGAEVIVPNQEFISGKVTNWTLSDAQRRKELLIKAKLSANPKEVVSSIRTVLEAREDLLKSPAPMVLYQGYSEYSHDFRVLFWLNRNLLVSSSEVALDIYDKLSQLGVANPVPVREIREHKKAD